MKGPTRIHEGWDPIWHYEAEYLLKRYVSIGVQTEPSEAKPNGLMVEICEYSKVPIPDLVYVMNSPGHGPTSTFREVVGKEFPQYID